MENKITKYKLHKVKTKWVVIGTTLCGSVLAATSSNIKADEVNTNSNSSAADKINNNITTSSSLINSTSNTNNVNDKSNNSDNLQIKESSVSSNSINSKSINNFATTGNNNNSNNSNSSNTNSSLQNSAITNSNSLSTNSTNSSSSSIQNNNSNQVNTNSNQSNSTSINNSVSTGTTNNSYNYDNTINDNPYHIDGVYDKYKLDNNGNVYNGKAFEYEKNGSSKEIDLNNTYWNLTNGELYSKEDNRPLMDENGNVIYSNIYDYDKSVYTNNGDLNPGDPYNSSDNQKDANNFGQGLNHLNDSIHGMVQDKMPDVTNNGVKPTFDYDNDNGMANNAYTNPDSQKNINLANDILSQKYNDNIGLKITNSDGLYYYPIDANVSANYFFGQDPAKLKEALTEQIDPSLYQPKYKEETIRGQKVQVDNNDLTSTTTSPWSIGATQWQLIGSDGELTDTIGDYPILSNKDTNSLVDNTDNGLTDDQLTAIKNIVKSTNHFNCVASTAGEDLGRNDSSPDAMFYGTLLPDGTLLLNDANCTRIIPLKREMSQDVINKFNQPVDQKIEFDNQSVLVPKYLVDQVSSLQGLTDKQKDALLGVLQGLTTSIVPGHTIKDNEAIIASNWVSTVQTVIDDLHVDQDGNLIFGADQYHRDRTLHVYTAPNGMIQIKIDKDGNVYYDKNSLQDTTFNWYVQSGMLAEFSSTGNGENVVTDISTNGDTSPNGPGYLVIPISARTLNYLSQVNMPYGSTNGFDRLNDKDTNAQNAYNKNSSYQVTFVQSNNINQFYGLPGNIDLSNERIDGVNKVDVDKAPLTSYQFESQVSGLPFIVSVGIVNKDVNFYDSATITGEPGIIVHYVNKLTGEKIQKDYLWSCSKPSDDTKIDGNDSTYIPPEEINGLKYVGYNTTDQLPLTINYKNYEDSLYPNNQITVYYMPQGSADIKYINTVTGEEMSNLPPKDSNGDVGGDYNFDEPEVPGYKITKVDGNISGKYEQDNPQHVIVYYTPQSGADIKYINKLTGEEMPTLPAKSDEGNVGDSFSWDEPEVPGYKIVGTDGPKDGKYEQDKVQHTIVYYMPQGTADIKYINKLTGEEMPTLPPKSNLGDVGDSFSWDEPNVDGYKIVGTTGPQNGNYKQDEPQHTIVYYMPQGGADVKYINTVTGEEMPTLPPKSSEGNVNDLFNWDKPEVPGYKITKVDGSLNGKYEQDKVQHTIIYYTPEVQKGSADVKYINAVTGEEMPTLPPKSSEGNIGDSFSWDKPEIPGFKITKVDGNLNGKYSKDTQHTIIYYTPDTPEVQKGSADVKYINSVTGEEMPNLPMKSSNGNAGDEFSWDEPEVPGYKITKVTGDLNGKYVANEIQHTIIYYTPEEQKGNADVKYVNALTGEEMPNLSMKSSEGNIGDAFSWSELDVPGYKIVKVTGDLNGKYSKDTQHTIVYYMPIKNKPTTNNDIKEQAQVGSSEEKQPTKQITKEAKLEQPKVINEEKPQSQKLVEKQLQLITSAKADEVKEAVAIKQQPQIGSSEELPQTGDNSNKVKEIIALASAGLIGMIGNALINKKKEN